MMDSATLQCQGGSHMRLAELCAETGVPAATVKYYLREGLLPVGRRLSATRAEYGPAHLERLRLIRALIERGGVTIDGVRRIVSAIENPPASRHDFLGEAQQAIDGPPPPVAVSAEAQEAVERLGWPECQPARLAHLQAAMDTAALAGFPVTVDRLVAYGQALEQVALFDLEALAADPRSATPEGALTP